MRQICAVLVSCVLPLTGCASLTGRQTPAGAPTSMEDGVGIPYYLTRPSFSIQVKSLREGKRAKPIYELVMTPVPDPDHRYEIALKAGLFATDAFNLTLLEDGRLVSLGAASEDTTGAIIKGLGSFAAAAVKVGAIAFSRGAQVTTAEAAIDRVQAVDGAKMPFVAKQIGDAKVVLRFLLNAPKVGDPAPSAADLAAAQKLFGYAADSLVRIADGEADQEVKTQRREESVLLLSLGLLADEPGLAGSPDPKSEREAAKKLREQAVSAIRGRLFEDADLAPGEEDTALLLGEFVSRLSERIAKLSKTIDDAEPEAVIESALKKAKDIAHADYAKYVAGTIERKALDTTLKSYDQAVARLLELDSDLRPTTESPRHEKLATYFASEPTATDDGNTSKAYTDYRGELDETAKRIHERLNGYLAKKEPKEEDSPYDGNQLSRTLGDVKEWPIDRAGEVYDQDQRLLRLADIWISYGGKEAVVFVAKSDLGRR